MFGFIDRRVYKFLNKKRKKGAWKNQALESP
jgi:hypothetical protein